MRQAFQFSRVLNRPVVSLKDYLGSLFTYRSGAHRLHGGPPVLVASGLSARGRPKTDYPNCVNRSCMEVIEACALRTMMPAPFSIHGRTIDPHSDAIVVPH